MKECLCTGCVLHGTSVLSVVSWVAFWCLSVHQHQEMMYHVVPASKNRYFSLEKGSLNSAVFLFCQAGILQHQTEPEAPTGNAGSALQELCRACKGWLFWNQSSHLICSLLGQKCCLDIRKDPINRLIQGIYKGWGYWNKPVSPPSSAAQLWYERRTHNSHSMDWSTDMSENGNCQITFFFSSLSSFL